jgi:hypothetical protein
MPTIHQAWKCSLLLVALLAGCRGSRDADRGAYDMALDLCNRGTLEDDLHSTAWKGPGVDGSGKVKTGRYVVSTTYLRFKPGATAEFVDVLGPIQARLRQASGLVAVRFGFSNACNAGRTLAVWADRESMISFISGPEHSAAAARVGDLSRGGGAAIHFDDDGSGATFARAASELAATPSQF